MVTESGKFDPPIHLGGDRWEIRSSYRPNEGFCIRATMEAATTEAIWFVISPTFGRLMQEQPLFPEIGG
jgi:hypothetical protein